MTPISSKSNNKPPTVVEQQRQANAPVVEEILRFAVTSYALMVVPLVPAWLIYQMPNLTELLALNTLCHAIALLGICAIEIYNGNL